MPPLGYESYEQIVKDPEIAEKERQLAARMDEIFEDFSKQTTEQRGFVAIKLKNAPKETPSVTYTEAGTGKTVTAWLAKGDTVTSRGYVGLYTEADESGTSSWEKAQGQTLRVVSNTLSIEYIDPNLQNLQPAEQLRCLQNIAETIDLIAYVVERNEE